jgi:hypothetical protein
MQPTLRTSRTFVKQTLLFPLDGAGKEITSINIKYRLSTIYRNFIILEIEKSFIIF